MWTTSHLKDRNKEKTLCLPPFLFWGPSLPHSVFIQLWKLYIFLRVYYYHIDIVNFKILSLNTFSKSK